MKKEVRILLGIGTLVVIAGIIGTLAYQRSVQSPPPKELRVSERLVGPDSQSIGPADAKVTIVEFFDPECESCAAFAPSVKNILKEFEGKVRFVVRYMPFHRNARVAAAYMEAAGEQGKYWQMQEIMFRKQSEWGEIHGAAPQPNRQSTETVFENFGKEIGLNIEQLNESAKQKKFQDKIDRDFADGRGLGVTKTPTFFVNGRLLARMNENDLRALINDELTK